MPDTASGTGPLPRAEIEHRVPGRMRLRVMARCGDAGFFQKAEAVLTGLPGVRSARANPHTAGILVEYDDNDDGAAVLAAAREHELFAAVPPDRTFSARGRVQVEGQPGACSRSFRSSKRATLRLTACASFETGRVPDDGHPLRAPTTETAQPQPRRLAPLLRQLGPGLASGAADDDPSGIATYSQAGAQLGYAACWILLLCYPMMVATQEISARIGRATGGGVVAALRASYPSWLVHLVVALVVFANTLNLGADLGAMGDVLQMLVGGPRLAYVVLSGLVCAGLLLRLRLRLYMRFVKWAALSLAVYVLAALSAAPSWGGQLRHLPNPALLLDAPSISIIVAVMGTTISPYLFIWQSSLEGERARGLPGLHRLGMAGLADKEMRRIRADTCAGMAVAVLVAFAVVVTAASTLHGTGGTVIETIVQAAEELREVAGPLAHLLFSLGILATGLLAVPALAGSAAFAVGEGLGWPVGLARPPGEARAFHGCILAATAMGIAMNLLDLDPMRALLWSAMANGLLAAPVLVAVMMIASRREVMGHLALSRPLATLGWLTTAAMAATALGLLATLGT